MLRQQTGIAPLGTNIHDAKWSRHDRRQGEGCPEDLTSTFPMRTVDGDNAGAVQLEVTPVDVDARSRIRPPAVTLPSGCRSTFDADEGPQASDALGKARLLGRQEDSSDILVCAGCLLGDAAH